MGPFCVESIGGWVDARRLLDCDKQSSGGLADADVRIGFGIVFQGFEFGFVRFCAVNPALAYFS
jgi:hypothetical protein